MVVLFVTLPGFLGTITGLFTGIANDSSAQSRTGSYAIATEFIQRAPVFGRGFSTFLPSYWILDNQYLGLLIEMGIVGLAGMLLLLTSGAVAAVRSRRRSLEPDVRQIGQALAASVTCGAVSLALFDLLGFPMSAGILFLMLGLCGALWRLVRQRSPTAPLSERATRGDASRPSRRMTPFVSRANQARQRLFDWSTNLF